MKKKKIQPFQVLCFYTFFPGSPTLIYDFMPFGVYDYLFCLIYIVFMVLYVYARGSATDLLSFLSFSMKRPR